MNQNCISLLDAFGLSSPKKKENKPAFIDLTSPLKNEIKVDPFDSPKRECTMPIIATRHFQWNYDLNNNSIENRCVVPSLKRKKESMFINKPLSSNNIINKLPITMASDSNNKLSNNDCISNKSILNSNNAHGSSFTDNNYCSTSSYDNNKNKNNKLFFESNKIDASSSSSKNFINYNKACSLLTNGNAISSSLLKGIILFYACNFINYKIYFQI